MKQLKLSDLEEQLETLEGIKKEAQRVINELEESKKSYFAYAYLYENGSVNVISSIDDSFRLFKEKIEFIKVGHIFYSIKMDRRPYMASASWEDVGIVARNMSLNGIRGHRPSRLLYDYSPRIVEVFNRKTQFLRANGIDADDFGGYNWFDEECANGEVFFGCSGVVDTCSKNPSRHSGYRFTAAF